MFPLLIALVTAWPAADAGPPIRIDSVEPLAVQPSTQGPHVIWADDFDGPEKPYTETSGGIDKAVSFGGKGGSMVCQYNPGSTGVGNRKVFFGDSPVGRVVRRGETFDDVYWRVYVRHQPGWKGGGPAKLSRITSIVSSKWNQAMIGHVWSVADTLTLDPASGVREGRVVTTAYNDFPNLHWLGNRPPARTAISATDESGWWVCVEARVKLNTPGRRDGLMQLWIDGRLESERTGLDWRGSYTGHALNAVFLEAYWNNGPPVAEKRWIDQFVIATKPIGPVVTARNPRLFLGGPDPEPASLGWTAEIAASDGVVVWESSWLAPGRTQVEVRRESGTFVGPLAGRDRLAADTVYFGRLHRGGGVVIPYGPTPWHQAFRTAAE
jgi:hypothetical protein